MTNLIQDIQQSTNFIHKKVKLKPSIGIVLGSGLNQFTNCLKDKIEIPYEDIPLFQTTSVSGHQGTMIFGWANETSVVCLQGRLHSYEGHSPETVAFPIQVLKQLGCSSVLLSNASGGINPNYSVGELVLVTDHINLTGKNPLIGPNDENIGPRFPDMTYAYNLKIQENIQNAAKPLLGRPLQEGIYAGTLGPSYETPSEVKMLRTLGADLVGMSTVFEVIAAHHCQLKVGVISCITNPAAGIKHKALDHSDVKKQALKIANNFNQLILGFLKIYSPQ